MMIQLFSNISFISTIDWIGIFVSPINETSMNINNVIIANYYHSYNITYINIMNTLDDPTWQSDIILITNSVILLDFNISDSINSTINLVLSITNIDYATVGLVTQNDISDANFSGMLFESLST